MAAKMGALNSKLLKTLRERRFRSQDQFAEALNQLDPELKTNQQAVSLWENGKNDPSLETILLIARTLGVSVDYLLGVVDEPDKHFVNDLELTPAKERLLWLIDKGQVVEALEEMTSIIKGGE